MKKIFKGLICAGIAGAIAAGMVGAAGCKKSSHRDPEKDPLRLAIGAVDEKFNPLYFTSANDGIIANLTQASLITSDANGDLAVGENQPTVALDYAETYYNKSGAVIARGDGTDINYENGYDEVDTEGSTTYEFLIKNDMKFSDGKDVTVMDVLFNLYVYLDPMYNGSSTIYSTKIKGLQAYRQNNPAASEDSNLSTAPYRTKAKKHISDLIKWSNSETETYVDKDLNKVKELYKEELTSDWNSNETSWSETFKEYNFTEAWQAFYFMEDVVTIQKRLNEYGTPVDVKDENGKYLTDLDPDVDTGKISQRGKMLADAMAEAASEAKINEHIAANENMSREIAKLELQKKYAIEYVHAANTIRSKIKDILTYNTTAGKALEYFIQVEQSEDAKNKEQKVFKIDGITVSHTADAKHNGTFNGKTYTDDHDILKIEIVGVDPKAKWNFGFAVAPLHYYSGTYGGVNYVSLAMDDYTSGKVYDGTATHFGVKYNDVDFSTDVLAASSKSGVPVGAGPYKCCTYKYNSDNLKAGTFFYNHMAFFERNTNFSTLGKGVDNAKIKYVTYKVTSDDQIVNSLKTGEIDYGEPTAKADNQTALGSFRQITYLTGGYGYVGINPKYVEDITIRRAIMMAFDTADIEEYYGEGLVNVIRRPMSTTSWVWDGEYGYAGKLQEPYYETATSAQDIIDFIKRDSKGKWQKDSGGWKYDGVRKSLTYNFTIAGETNDHPAYQMFVNAKNILEEAGFNITVGNDPKALQKLVTGDLHVWAAAWSSGIDPDPYQIYSINSKASSTNNWNKDNIMEDGSGKFQKEQEIATKLNAKIMEGRQSIDRRTRAGIYAGEDGCLDLIMELAVEFPTYQRKDLCVFNASILDESTMTAAPSHFMGPISELWKLNYVQ